MVGFTVATTDNKRVSQTGSITVWRSQRLGGQEHAPARLMIYMDWEKVFLKGLDVGICSMYLMQHAAVLLPTFYE
jgi:hypothetical protein